jgi:hypothetical protein
MNASFTVVIAPLREYATAHAQQRQQQQQIKKGIKKKTNCSRRVQKRRGMSKEVVAAFLVSYKFIQVLPVHSDSVTSNAPQSMVFGSTASRFYSVFNLAIRVPCRIYGKYAVFIAGQIKRGRKTPSPVKQLSQIGAAICRT